MIAFLGWMFVGLIVYVVIALLRLPTLKKKKDFKIDEYEVLSLMIMGPIGIAFIMFQAINTFNVLNKKRIQRERTAEKDQG